MAASTPRIDSLEDPTGMSDALATKLGHKIYSHGNTYNGGNAPTVTLNSGGGSLSSVNLAHFIPYQTQSGDWRLKFNIHVTLSLTTRTVARIAVNGISFPSAPGTGQAISGAPPLSASNSYATQGSNLLEINHASGNTDNYGISGDIFLSSKPTWAY